MKYMQKLVKGFISSHMVLALDSSTSQKHQFQRPTLLMYVFALLTNSL